MPKIKKEGKFSKPPIDQSKKLEQQAAQTADDNKVWDLGRTVGRSPA
jgi:hypothetical protein